MAVYKIHKTENFTVMSNYHLQDTNISLKAKGMLSMMLSLPDNWDYSIKGLETLSNDGITIVRNTLVELEKFGYLQRKQIKINGKIVDWEYNIYETPQLEKPLVEKPLVENLTQLNTNIQNTKKLNKEIYKENSASAETFAEETETEIPTTLYLQKQNNSKLLAESKKEEVFDYLWSICARKENKEQARKTFSKLMKECRTEDEVVQKGRAIYQNYEIACNQWKEEERDKKFVPLLSSWLNDNVPEKMIKRK